MNYLILKNMKMNRIISIIAAALTVLAIPSFAQTTTSREDYLQRYSRLVDRVGVSGVGVETLVKNWEKDYPEDIDMLLAKFSFCLSKSRSSEVQIHEGPKYLGENPILSLKDSLSNNVYYFQVTKYDDELFGTASSAIDKAIELDPNRLDLRLYKAAALIDYEKESPDMASAYLNGIIDYNSISHPKWTYPGIEEVDDEAFCALIQEYCYTFFRMGAPGTFEVFRQLSEKMSKNFPSSPIFQTNIGSYYLVYKHDSSTALKIYNKVLKKHPDDYATIKNCVLLARTDKDTKLEKKYLPMLIKTTPDENERNSAEVRLKALQ